MIKDFVGCVFVELVRHCGGVLHSRQILSLFAGFGSAVPEMFGIRLISA
jgi:hypothetical protein